MISIIVPTYNEEAYVGALLEQLKPFVGTGLEIIVSDNQSTDLTTSVVKKFPARLVKADRHLTIGQVRNVGAVAAAGDILCFFDADTTMADPRQFMKKIHEHSATPLVAVIGPVSVNPHEERSSDRWNMSMRTGLIRFANIIGFGAGSGEFFAVTRDLWSTSGGFKENFAAGEDNELFQRLRRLGHVLYDRQLTTYTSSRRIRRDGWLRLWYSWSRNFFSSLFRGKSADRQWNAPR